MTGDPKDPEEENDKDRASYEVGYGKPPRHSRFRPGQSGNPKGKSKGQKTFKAIARDALNEKVTVRTSRGTRRISKLEAIILTTSNNALKGDAKAIDLTLKVAREIGMDDEIAEAVNAARTENLIDEDQAILERFLRKQGKSLASGDG